MNAAWKTPADPYVAGLDMDALINGEAAPMAAEVKKVEEVMPLNMQLDAFAFPDSRVRKNKDGEITGVSLLSTAENLQHMLKGYGVTVRYNEMAKAEEICIPGVAFSSDNGSNASLATLSSLCRRNAMPVTELLGYVTLIAEQNSYHPVRDWVSSKPWDRISRLQALCDTIAVLPEYEAHRNSMLKRWTVSVIAAVFSTKTTDSFHGTLALQGGQGIGKTSWFLRLMADVAGAAKGGQHLNPSNKDSQLEALKHTIVELGELDGNYRKVDINELKGWLTKSEDELRQAYAVRHNLFKRRTVFGATVNESKFLVDSTGNRRWWTVPALSIDFKHTMDMQQFWAEMLVLYKAGEQWHLTALEDAELSRLNGRHEVDRPMEELLETYFVFEAEQRELDGSIKPHAKAVGMNPTMISRVMGLGFEGNQSKLNELGKSLRKLTGQQDAKPVRAADGKPIKGWLVVPRDANMFQGTRRT